MSPDRVVLCGDSGGGNLLPKQAFHFLGAGLALPGHIILYSHGWT
jgi:hypothetical protein